MRDLLAQRVWHSRIRSCTPICCHCRTLKIRSGITRQVSSLHVSLRLRSSHISKFRRAMTSCQYLLCRRSCGQSEDSRQLIHQLLASTTLSCKDAGFSPALARLATLRAARESQYLFITTVELKNSVTILNSTPERFQMPICGTRPYRCLERFSSACEESRTAGHVPVSQTCLTDCDDELLPPSLFVCISGLNT